MVKKDIKESSKELYNLLEKIFEDAGDGICIIDNSSNIIMVNERLARLLGVSKDEMLNKKCYDLYSKFICNSIECPKERISSGEYYNTYEIEKVVNDKTIPFLITAVPLFSNDKEVEGIILSFKDITTITKYQYDLNKAKQKAEKSSLLKTNFLANMSHEIRTSMNGVIGLIELLEDTELNLIQKEYIDMLKFSADRLLSIINNVLDLSKIEVGRLDLINNKFHFNNLFEEIGRYFKIQANKKGIDFYYKSSDEIPDTIIGDIDRLSQVLFNIIGNAIKFTEKGFVSLEIEIDYEDLKYIYLKFIIKDSGLGIPNEKIDSIFSDFNQLDSSATKKYGGTGLGLTISKKLIELMDGEIKVQSELGKGSEFSFYIKCLKDNTNYLKAKFLDLEKNIKENTNYDNLNILVAEDDLINQKIIKRILEKNNWNATVVSNGKEVLEYLKHNNTDIILMDISMPEMDGFEVAKIIREREKSTGGYTPIIALTAAAMKEDREKCLEIGMNGYMSKPIRSNIIYQTIFDVLNKSDTIDGLNIEQLLERIDGDSDVLIEIIKEVMSDDYENEYLGNIEIYIEKENLEGLSKQVHKFKGSISNFGASNIINILEKMDNCIKNRELNTIKELFKELKIEFNKTKGKLKKYNSSKS